MFVMKRAGKVGFLALIVLLLLSLITQAQANPRYASIVIDADTGEVLHESRANASRYPASLTKMMTLYMLFEAMKQRRMTLHTRMLVSTHSASMPQTNIGLLPGDTISVRKAIPALIVRSANDVAAVVAEALGGTESNFGRLMTDKARKLGMNSTTFRNASGLPNSAQKTTAKDMVILSARLMKDFPQHYHYFSTQSFQYKGVTYNSHNRMIRNTEGVDGLKTGYIRASGFNVATSAKRGGRRVIAVVMGGKTAGSRDRHIANLLDRTFSKPPTIRSASVTPNVIPGIGAPVPVPKFKPPSNLKPVSKPIPLLEKLPDQAMMQLITHPDTRIIEVAMVDDNSWAVQIGTYLEHNRAQAQAEVANRWVAGEMVVTEVDVSNRKLFRARLEGLQEIEARTACKRLARQGMECLVVR
ncbi:MAG: D-alanyl-D-alanine carboxypeptidase [Betaproteobacteria bacterium]|nr:D-alanyl-D-alanine carboxypeptidase [Betaproteobacteria bacterium]